MQISVCSTPFPLSVHLKERVTYSMVQLMGPTYQDTYREGLSSSSLGQIGSTEATIIQPLH